MQQYFDYFADLILRLHILAEYNGWINGYFIKDQFSFSIVAIKMFYSNQGFSWKTSINLELW